MTERGKYHGQRLTAKQVLSYYAAGERDFRGAILRGCNFRSAELSGADFSGADIRGARFVDAILRGVRFTSSKNGLTNSGTLGVFLGIVMILMFLSALLGFCNNLSYQVFISPFYRGSLLLDLGVTSISLRFFVEEVLPPFLIVAFFAILLIGGARNETLSLLAFLLVVYVVVQTVHTGFEVITYSSPIYFNSVRLTVIYFGFLISYCAFYVLLKAFLEIATLKGLIFIPVIFVFSVGLSVVVSTGVGFGNYSAALELFTTFRIEDAYARIADNQDHLELLIENFNAGEKIIEMSFYTVSASLIFGLSLSAMALNFKNTRSSSRYLNQLSSRVSSIFGTEFSGANLADAYFNYSLLGNTNFADSRRCSIVLTHVRWHQAQGLDRSRLCASNLRDPSVRKLLVTLNGVDQDFSLADLRNANLAGAKLHRADFRRADLGCSELHGAELHGANLTEAQCVGTDFTAAHLTGACLEAWNIDETTILKDIDCQHVFLKEQPDGRGNRERRPHDPNKDFQPGDFEQLFKEMLDTVQILIRNGVNPDAFKAALQALMENHPDISRDAIRGFERKGDDVLVTLQVPEGTDKADIERTWDEVYEARLQAATARAQLQAEQRRGDDLKELALGFSSVLSSIEITNMNNPVNTGDKSFYAGGDVSLTNSNLNFNLEHISGEVSNAITQLPDAAPTPNQPNLKDLLTQLQAAVEADAELSDDEKAEALGEVGKLAKAGSNPQEGAMQRLAQRATATLKALTEPLTEASKLATACKTLLPLIVALF